MSSHRNTGAIPLLDRKIDSRDERFQRNYDANLQALAEVNEVAQRALNAGSERAVKRHRAAGKLLARERIAKLLDRDSWFLEICPLAGADVSGQTPGAGLIGGVGIVGGTECVITASDPCVKGGAVTEFGVLKTHRLAEIAEDNGLPTISLIESAGADLPNQHKIFLPGGRGFRDITRASRARRPSVCLVFGSSTAGGAYIPGMSDYVVMVKEQAQVYLAGPPLVKMATGEVSTHEELGGADMHSRVSGVSDFLADDEIEAIRIGRALMGRVGADGQRQQYRPQPALPPRFDPDELLGIASADIRQPFDSRDVIARIVDDSRFHEFKPLYGSTLVCGWANLHGYPVGILANNGTLFTESANKGAQFIQLCNQTDTPLIFLQNITGFMVGKRVEQEGIIKAGAKLINAVSNSTVPAITIMIGGSFGAGNYAMSGRAYAPRFLFTWPNHRIAVMGGRELAGVLDIIKREAAAKRGEELDEDNLAMMKAMVEHQIDNESHALFATARLWDDGIIDPRDTRDVLGICLRCVHKQAVRGTMEWGVFRH